MILNAVVSIALFLILIGSMAFLGHRSKLSARRQPAPPLPRWACMHPTLIEVESGGEVVAYICEKCDDQVNLDDQAAVNHRKAEKIAKRWADLTDDLTEDREVAQAQAFAARTRLAELAAGSPYIMVTPDLESFRTKMLTEGETRPAPILKRSWEW